MINSLIVKNIWDNYKMNWKKIKTYYTQGNIIYSTNQKKKKNTVNSNLYYKYF